MIRPSFALACALLALPAMGDTNLHLDQQAQKTVPRDRLQAELRVEASGPDSRTVQDEVNRRMGNALAKARKSAALTVQSGGYSVYREQPPKGQEVWHANQALSFASKDFDAVLKLSGDLQNDGLAMSNLRFYLAPETLRAAQSELTAQALSALRDRANEVAADLGMSVAQYKDVVVGNATEGFEGRRPMMMMMAKAAAAPLAVAPPEAEGGDSTITLSVQAEVVLH
ncbi:MAG TPA: SIMPL domain-containing protein [Magnetospirillaceae bacterium]|nr:SIMPL domain-containing protein [Magnetospirillaceae bacterium]